MLFYRIVWLVCHIFYPIYGLRVIGRENLPAGGALLCPNHAHGIDPVLLYLALPVDYRLRTMAKESLFRIPLLRHIIKAFGAFPVKRDTHDVGAVKTAMQILKSGGNLMIFPEGTRIKNGVGIHDGKPAHAHLGIATIGVRTQTPLIPVYIETKKRIFGGVRIIFGEPYRPEVTDRHPSTEELHAIADETLRRVYALGGKKVGGEPL